jgi:uncharacterized protein YicC (UPF0701 family)
MKVAALQPLEEYFAALERLKTGNPKIVRKGTRITNDSVSMEAGRGKGSIKKSRDTFADLISSITLAAAEQSSPKIEQKERLARTRSMAAQYQCDLEAALAREVSLLKELYDIRKELARLTGDNVVPIRRQ